MSGGAPIPVPTKEVILSIDDLKEAGSKNLTKVVREFFNSGSTDQRTITDNSAALTRFRLRSRVMISAKNLTTKSTVFNDPKCEITFPFGIAPAGIAGAAHPDGDKASSAAASKWGICQAVSSFASYSIEDVVKAGGGKTPAYAMQLYPMKDRGLQERIVRRAEDAGCRAIFLTGDSPVLGVRYNEWRNDFRTPEGIGFPMLERDTENIRKTTHDTGFTSFNEDDLSWERDIKWLRERTKMQIFVKGVLCAEDVKMAIKYGLDGVVISNHGGRQLDGVPATIDVLEECVEAAKGSNLQIHVDGGFRRGSDILVALALGAQHVWVGRPTLWGLAYDGQKGVERMIEIFYEDFRRCMALCGCRSIAEINRSCLSRMGSDGVLRPLARADGAKL